MNAMKLEKFNPKSLKHWAQGAGCYVFLAITSLSVWHAFAVNADEAKAFAKNYKGSVLGQVFLNLPFGVKLPLTLAIMVMGIILPVLELKKIKIKKNKSPAWLTIPLVFSILFVTSAGGLLLLKQMF